MLHTQYSLELMYTRCYYNTKNIKIKLLFTSFFLKIGYDNAVKISLQCSKENKLILIQLWNYIFLQFGTVFNHTRCQ